MNRHVFTGCLVLLLVQVLLPLQAGAGKLDELFGVQLQVPCEVCQGEPAEEADGMRLYYITPPAPEKGLELYQARISVKKGRIVDVSAVGLTTEEEEARALYNRLRAKYQRKYGDPDETERHRSQSCVFRVKGSQRVLTLLLRDEFLDRRWVVYVNAMDRKAFARARKASGQDR